jgi:hypothetical protein
MGKFNKKPKNPGTPKRKSKKHTGGKSHVKKRKPLNSGRPSY